MFDLLSLAARRQTLTNYPIQITRDDADLIFWLFHCGAGFPEGPIDADLSIRGQQRWQDAEQFLEILDNACVDAAKAAIVEEVFNTLSEGAPSASLDVKRRYPKVFIAPCLPRPDALLALARRTIAASCCAFLEGVTGDNAGRKERWLPYRQWLERLRENDSILTFNYDRVVELLEPRVGNSLWGVHVSDVDGPPADNDGEDEARHANLPLLYKLHGSVNWHYEGNRVKKLEWSPEVLGERFNLAIATPGDSKMQMAGGIFKRLWTRAEEALRDADDVFIIGFRFPQSDAFPRDKLLAALAQNDRQCLNVHVVLGPDQNADVRRVLALLRWTVKVKPTFDEIGDFGGRALISHSLWAEDFLSVWSRLDAGRAG